MWAQRLPIAPDLAAFLTRERAALARAWADLVCQIPQGRYHDTAPEQVQMWMAHRIDAISGALASGSFEALDARLAQVALIQLQQQYMIAEVLEGLLLGKEAILPFIWDYADGDAALVRDWSAWLDACLRHIIWRIGAEFAATNAQQLRAQEQLHAQIAQLATVAERQRLAHDLHDSVAQSLYSLTLYSEAASGALGDGDLATARAHLGEIQRIAQDGLREMRLLLFNLRPPVLEQEGLIAALQARLDAVEARAALQTELRFEGDEDLPLPTKEALYHIAQEALTNTLKHARAQHVAVALWFGATVTRMEISDDGQGFDLGGVAHAGGFGLRGMQERVEQLGGQLTIRSTPGAGTRITLEVPQ
jgi:signal transduction histidine kinase